MAGDEIETVEPTCSCDDCQEGLPVARTKVCARKINGVLVWCPKLEFLLHPREAA
jgi:hypothetical protein